MKQKNLMMHVCTFVCGLVVGGAVVSLMGGNESGNTVEGDSESVTETKTEYSEAYSQVYGIDMSLWQGFVHWDQLFLPCNEDGSVSGTPPSPRQQRPVQFIFIRATKSDSIVDTLYQENYNEAKQLGIPCGTYHFLTDTVSGKVQAELFLAHAQLEKGDLPPVLDVEVNSPKIVEIAKEWLEIVEEKCGTKAIIYSNMNVYNTWIKNDPILGTRDLWLAKLSGEMPDEPKCLFWQFTHEGHVWGIIDNVVDIDMFNGTAEELQEYIQTKGIKG